MENKNKQEVWDEKKVIKLLDWILHSKTFHTQGMNGWGQYGHSAYSGFTSKHVLETFKKEKK